MNMSRFKIAFCPYLLLLIFFLEQPISAEECQMSMLDIDLNWQIRNADAIVVARLVKVPLSYRNRVLGIVFYRFEMVEILAGALEKNSYLFLITNADSFEGNPVIVEEGLRYLMFLKKDNLPNNDAEKDLLKEDGLLKTDTSYSLLKNWAGFLPLSPNAKEKRFQMSLKEWHDIDASSLPIVCQAIKAAAMGLLDTNEGNGGNEGEAKKIPEDVQNIAKKLGLDNCQKFLRQNAETTKGQ